MQLRRWSTAVFVVLFIAGSLAYTLSPYVPSVGATPPDPMADGIRQLGGAFSMLAMDVRAMRTEMAEREKRDTERVTAEIISRQQLTEAVDRLTKAVEKKP
jgi:hypothetical protein